jgi:dinuclear metal center YbgI/SA1388 family protein
MITVENIYRFIDSEAPFRLQQSYDNSGLCVGSQRYEVRRILVSLDCTKDVVKEAFATETSLIVTHHPVIFRPIKRLDFDSTAGLLAAAKISVISAHTNFDSSVMNDILCEKLGLETLEPLAVEDGAPIGYVCACGEEGVLPFEMARDIRERLGSGVVRYNDEGKKLRRIAVCSGSGGSLLPNAAALGCDALITGDVKHDVFIDAHNQGIVVFDAGHFHTENIFCEYMQNLLSENFPDIDVAISESGRDLLSYEV